MSLLRATPTIHKVMQRNTTIETNCILNSVEDKYITVLKDKVTRYAKIPPNHPQSPMEHIRIRHDRRSQGKRRTHENSMNPPNPIELLVLQLEDGKAFAEEGGEIIDNSQLVQLRHDNVFATGQFTKYCTEWRKRKVADKK